MDKDKYISTFTIILNRFTERVSTLVKITSQVKEEVAIFQTLLDDLKKELETEEGVGEEEEKSDE